jgi:two-component system, sensor histidine kinase
MNVLIVDDSPINRGLMETLFKKIVRESLSIAENGQQALEVYRDLAKSKDQIVILIDINMPVMNGIESIKHIRKYERENKLSPCHIMVITDYNSANAEYLAKMVGANAFLSRPIHKEDLLKELRRLLGEESVIFVEK